MRTKSLNLEYFTIQHIEIIFIPKLLYLNLYTRLKFHHKLTTGETSNQTGYRPILSPTRREIIEPGSADPQGINGQEDAFLPVMLFIDLVRVSIGLLLSSCVFFSSKKNDHLIFPAAKNKTKQTDKSKRNKPGIQVHAPPRKRKKHLYIRFSKRWLPPFCTRIKVLVFFVGAGFEVWLSVCVPITSFVRGKVFLPKFEFSSMSKQSSTVVGSNRPV